MKFLQKTLALAVIVLLSASCSLKQVIYPAVPPAQPDFTKYIAIGDSQTAGYANDGLYLDGQLSSYPNLLATQMKAAGGGAFYQPLFDAAHANGSGYLKLTGLNADGTPVTVRTTDNLGVRSTNPTLFIKYTGNINNYGVTGISLANITDPTYGNVNPYYEMLLPNVPPANTMTYQDFVLSNAYTFFTCWLGNNDVLGYAINGGDGALPTDKDIFSRTYTTLINKLAAKGQMGAVANVPDVSSIPYFNTITVSAINTKIQKTVPGAAIYINARTAADVSTTTYAARLANNNDLLVLTFDAGKIGQYVSTPSGLQPYGLSPLAPVENRYVLDANEVTLVRGYVTSYNLTIKAAATAQGLALFDVNSYLNQVKPGLVIDGVTVSSAFITGGVFSLDGVHLTPRGYAMEANEFARAINSQYATSLKTVNISGYAGVIP